MYNTEVYDEAWERAWTGASDFERRRYRSLDAASGLAVLMLVAGSAPLGDAIKEATRYAGRLDGTEAER
jgi:hypothetical protein